MCVSCLYEKQGNLKIMSENAAKIYELTSESTWKFNEIIQLLTRLCLRVLFLFVYPPANGRSFLPLPFPLCHAAAVAVCHPFANCCAKLSYRVFFYIIFFLLFKPDICRYCLSHAYNCWRLSVVSWAVAACG